MMCLFIMIVWKASNLDHKTNRIRLVALVGVSGKTPLNCTQADRFQKLSRLKSSVLLQFWINSTKNFEECDTESLKYCSCTQCTAYANFFINEGPDGCLIWFGNLVDIRLFISENSLQLDLYVRLACT